MSQPVKKRTKAAKSARAAKTAPSQPARPAAQAKRYAFNPMDRYGKASAAPRPLSLLEDMPEPERIDQVPLESVVPDAWQGRRPLPVAIRARFQAGEISAEQAVRDWVTIAENDSLARARLEPYRTLARSIGEHEQINPISVVKLPPSADAGPMYRIETGERRFWAAWLAVVEMGRADHNLKVVIRDQFDAVRQAEENSTQTPLGAVEMARTVARTFLEEVGVTPDGSYKPGSIEFYRRALEPAESLIGDGAKYTPRGIWPAVEKALGLSRQHMEHLLALLGLPEMVLDVADAYGVPERVLRSIMEINVSPERQLEVVEAAGRYHLGSPLVRRLCQAEDFTAELELIKAEMPAEPEPDEPGYSARNPRQVTRSKRATPATREAGEQFADRLNQLRRTVVRYAKGTGTSETAVVGQLTGAAMRLQPDEARDWLSILRPLVTALEQAVRKKSG